MRVAGKGDGEGLKKGIENLLGSEYMHFLGCMTGFVSVYLSQNLRNCTLEIYVIYGMPVIHIIK